MPVRQLEHWAFIGKPLCGKDTCVDWFNTAYPGRFRHVSTGNLIRAKISTDEAFRKIAREVTTAGKLLPDVHVNPLAVEALLKIQSEDVLTDPAFGKMIVIWNGFPRNLLQQAFFEPEHVRFSQIFHLDIADNVINTRLQRLTCPVAGCGRTYLPGGEGSPTIKGRCDIHPEATLIVREDEGADKVRQRLASFQTETLPLIELLARQGRVTQVKAYGSFYWIHEHLGWPIPAGWEWPEMDQFR